MGNSFVNEKLAATPARWAQAKNEYAEVRRLLKSGDITVSQLGKGIVVGLEVFGAFCLGEVITRGSVVGYKV